MWKEEILVCPLGHLTRYWDSMRGGDEALRQAYSRILCQFRQIKGTDRGGRGDELSNNGVMVMWQCNRSRTMRFDEIRSIGLAFSRRLRKT